MRPNHNLVAGEGIFRNWDQAFFSFWGLENSKLIYWDSGTDYLMGTGNSHLFSLGIVVCLGTGIDYFHWELGLMYFNGNWEM